MKFQLKAPFIPTGDQPQAIAQLVEGIRTGKKHQVLLGVTGSGKTFTIANVIEQTQLPTLVISHNKTLAAQLYQEFREFFPHNAVGFFVSYYDYYQPEAYIPQTDTYIAKETEINEEIDKLRLQATSFIFSRRDVIIVASVSCIYNIGSPREYGRYVIELRVGQKITQENLCYRLVHLHYRATRWDLNRGEFRRRGDVLEIFPAYSEEVLRIHFHQNRIAKLILRPIFGGKMLAVQNYLLYPAKHYLTNPDILETAFAQIRQDLAIRKEELLRQGKVVEAQRLEQRVEYDLEMIKEVGYVNGIENYSRYFDGRAPGDPPFTLLDYFRHAYGNHFLVVIDESHITIPQLKGMYRGDKARKQTLIDFGFRLPSCLDNRPLRFKEFLKRVPQVIYVSATPDSWEIKKAKGRVIEQLIRPTGLPEPKIIVKPTKNQVQDLIKEIINHKRDNKRVLVTTLTKRLAEDLAEFLADPKNTFGTTIKVAYLHADVDTLTRSQILADLRRGRYDVIVGINLLREGLDLPEVALVAILDADTQGFLRSKTALIQTMGRAARNAAGKVILYADRLTPAMKQAIAEVKRRRKTQLAYNRKHHIVPKTVKKPLRAEIVQVTKPKEKMVADLDPASLTPGERQQLIKQLRKQMRQAAANLEFEKAARIRDKIKTLAQY